MDIRAINEDLDNANESSSLIDKEPEKPKDSIFLNRYFALALMGFSLLGQNFVVDNPAGELFL